MLLRKDRTRRGLVVVMTALLMVVLLGMVAFAVDIGYILVARGEAQNAADAAALAAIAKMTEQLKQAPLVVSTVEGKQVVSLQQTIQDLEIVRNEAKSFASKNRVAACYADVKDSEIEIGYLGDPYNQTISDLDTTGWPARPYNAVRVTVKRDQQHTGGSLRLFFAPVLGVRDAEVSATATAVVALGTAIPRGNKGTINGGLLPFTYAQTQWEDLLKQPTGSSSSVDLYSVDDNASGPGGVTQAADNRPEAKLFPGKTTSGNFGTINFTKTKSSNSTNVLRDLIEFGPDLDDWPDLLDIVAATTGTPVSVNGDPGLSAGMESAVKAIIGQPRILPLYTGSPTGTGNNTFYKISGFVPVTVVDVNLKGSNKYILIQPRVITQNSNLGNGKRLTFDMVPSTSSGALFLGGRALVR